MEGNFLLLCLLACLGVLVWESWRVFNSLWLKPKSLERCLREQGFSGNPYRLLFGDTHDSSRMHAEAMEKPMSFSHDYIPRILPFLSHTIRYYGEHSFTWHGPMPIINITDPELIKEVLNRIHDFQKPINSPLISLVVTGLVEYEGEKWAKHRKLLTPAFHMEKLKQMLPTFYTSCENMINKWEKMVSETGSCEVDVCSFLTTLTADVISRAAFGSTVEEGQTFFELLREQFKLAVILSRSVYIPGWRFVPTKENKRILEIEREMEDLLQDMIFTRKKEEDAKEARKDDLLGALMKLCFEDAQTDGSKKQCDFGLTLKEVVKECKLFYLAGQETTSSLLVWTMILLSKHQDWQVLAREEVLTIFGDSAPTFDGLSRLKIVTMIINEVLRLYPPAIEIRRRTTSDVKLGKFSFPTDVLLSMPLILVHHDNRYWGDDAKEFNPQRFAKGVSNAANGNICFFPFSWGPRVCLGQSFTMVEAKMALAMILQRFSFELSASYTHAPSQGVMLQPQFGAHLILQRL